MLCARTKTSPLAGPAEGDRQAGGGTAAGNTSARPAAVRSTAAPVPLKISSALLLRNPRCLGEEHVRWRRSAGLRERGGQQDGGNQSLDTGHGTSMKEETSATDSPWAAKFS